MNGTVSVYFNTGFNGVDIPADPSVLELCPKKVYPDVYYVREDIDKPSIKIKDSYENLCNVDYCKIETSNKTCYYFAAPTALAQGVTQLSLDLDALLTMGGAKNLHYISGWQERGHITKSEDQLFHNVASESWTPSNPLRAVNLELISLPHDNVPGENLVMTNIDFKALGALEDDVIKIMEGVIENDAKMYLPMIETPPEEDSTSFMVWDDETASFKSFKTPSTVLYRLDADNIRKGISKLYSAGQLQLQASYTIPKEYIDWGQTEVEMVDHFETGLYKKIAGIHQVSNLSNLPFEYSPSGYTVKNKKCLETYRTFVIVNLGSGDMSIKSPHEIYDPAYPTSSPKVRVWADPTSTGKPYARFDYIRDNPLQWADTVKGLQWANAQLSLEGASGSMWNSISAAFQSQNINRAMEQGVYDSMYSSKYNALSREAAQIGQTSALAGNYLGQFGSWLGVGAAVGKGALNAGMIGYGNYAGNGDLMGKGVKGYGGTLGNAINAGMALAQSQFNQGILEQQYANQYEALLTQREQAAQNDRLNTLRLQQQVNENEIDLYKNNNVVAPSLMFTPEQNLGLYGYNKFAIYEVRKDDDDLKSEDMYYQRFGYSGLHRPLTSECFNARQYYSYVQAFNVNLEGSEQFGLRVRQKAISQLNSGVRVWKVVPNPSYYESN